VDTGVFYVEDPNKKRTNHSSKNNSKRERERRRKVCRVCVLWSLQDKWREGAKNRGGGAEMVRHHRHTHTLTHI
jgi:hypothetical protein